MTARSAFGVASRVVGLIVALYVADWLLRFVLGQLGYFKLERTDIGYYLLSGMAYLVVGAYFLRGAPHFVRFAYGEKTSDDESDEDGEI